METFQHIKCPKAVQGKKLKKKKKSEESDETEIVSFIPPQMGMPPPPEMFTAAPAAIPPSQPGSDTPTKPLEPVIPTTPSFHELRPEGSATAVSYSSPPTSSESVIPTGKTEAEIPRLLIPTQVVAATPVSSLPYAPPPMYVPKPSIPVETLCDLVGERTCTLMRTIANAFHLGVERMVYLKAVHENDAATSPSGAKEEMKAEYEEIRKGVLKFFGDIIAPETTKLAGFLKEVSSACGEGGTKINEERLVGISAFMVDTAEKINKTASKIKEDTTRDSMKFNEYAKNPFIKHVPLGIQDENAIKATRPGGGQYEFTRGDWKKVTREMKFLTAMQQYAIEYVTDARAFAHSTVVATPGVRKVEPKVQVPAPPTSPLDAPAPYMPIRYPCNRAGEVACSLMGSIAAMLCAGVKRMIYLRAVCEIDVVADRTAIAEKAKEFENVRKEVLEFFKVAAGNITEINGLIPKIIGACGKGETSITDETLTSYVANLPDLTEKIGGVASRFDGLASAAVKRVEDHNKKTPGRQVIADKSGINIADGIYRTPDQFYKFDPGNWSKLTKQLQLLTASQVFATEYVNELCAFSYLAIVATPGMEKTVSEVVLPAPSPSTVVQQAAVKAATAAALVTTGTSAQVSEASLLENFPLEIGSVVKTVVSSTEVTKQAASAVPKTTGLEQAVVEMEKSTQKLMETAAKPDTPGKPLEVAADAAGVAKAQSRVVEEFAPSSGFASRVFGTTASTKKQETQEKPPEVAAAATEAGIQPEAPEQVSTEPGLGRRAAGLAASMGGAAARVTGRGAVYVSKVAAKAAGQGVVYVANKTWNFLNPNRKLTAEEWEQVGQGHEGSPAPSATATTESEPPLQEGMKEQLKKMDEGVARGHREEVARKKSAEEAQKAKVAAEKKAEETKKKQEENAKKLKESQKKLTEASKVLAASTKAPTTSEKAQVAVVDMPKTVVQMDEEVGPLRKAGDDVLADTRADYDAANEAIEEIITRQIKVPVDKSRVYTLSSGGFKEREQRYREFSSSLLKEVPRYTGELNPGRLGELRVAAKNAIVAKGGQAGAYTKALKELAKVLVKCAKDSGGDDPSSLLHGISSLKPN